MQLPDNWSQTLNDWLQETSGTPVKLETLGGQSQASVYRVSFREKALILKKSATAKEKLFYEMVAPLLNENGISTPRLERAEYADGFFWLILEAIPHPLPRQRWQGDAEIVAALRRLHTITPEPPPELPEIYRPQWTEKLTALALEIFPEKARNQLEPLLSEIGQNYQYLFYPENLISGDPNPTNWGLREDGTLVLFDWERFGYGTPALDLAISVGGMGTREIFRRVAAFYLAEQHGQVSSSVEKLAQEIAVAKIWSVLEYLSFFAEGKLKSAETVNYLVQRFEEWARSLFD